MHFHTARGKAASRKLRRLKNKNGRQVLHSLPGGVDGHVVRHEHVRLPARRLLAMGLVTRDSPANARARAGQLHCAENAGTTYGRCGYMPIRTLRAVHSANPTCQPSDLVVRSLVVGGQGDESTISNTRCGLEHEIVSLTGPLSLLTLHRTSPPDQEVSALRCSQQAVDVVAAMANGYIAAPFQQPPHLPARLCE